MKTGGSLKYFVTDCGIQKRVYKFEKDIDVDLFSLTYFPHIIYTFCLQTDMTQIL